jgi:hypothetical protein
MTEYNQSIKSNTIITAGEFLEAWDWYYSLLTVSRALIQEHNYYLDHKHIIEAENVICIDEFKESADLIARLYLVSQLSSVSDFFSVDNGINKSFSLLYHSSKLDDDFIRVVKSKKTIKNQNSFRNSLSEHLSFWTFLVSDKKADNWKMYAISKPNFQPEDKGPDGVICEIINEEIIIKIISIKNSIGDPQTLISTSDFRQNGIVDENAKKILHEFYAFRINKKGFQRIDDHVNTLFQELGLNSNQAIRYALLNSSCQYNGSIIANDRYCTSDLFEGFSRILDEPKRCLGVYIGFTNWDEFSTKVQISVNHILKSRGY